MSLNWFVLYLWFGWISQSTAKIKRSVAWQKCCEWTRAHLELSMMLCRRWAMVRTVQWENSLRMVFWIRLSVSRSTAAVASSRINIRDFLNRARARHTSCLCPTLEENRHAQEERCICRDENSQLHRDLQAKILYSKLHKLQYVWPRNYVLLWL